MARIVSCDDHNWKFCGFVYPLTEGLQRDILMPVGRCLKCRDVKFGTPDMTNAFCLIVLTGKNFKDFALLQKKLDKLTMLKSEVILITTYSALVEQWAKINYWTVYRYSEKRLDAMERGSKNRIMKRTVFHWKPKSIAREMVKDAHAVVAFWDYTDSFIGKVIGRAKKKDIPIREYLT